MEKSILQNTSDTSYRFADIQMFKTAKILEVRIWENSGILEVDLHLPSIDIKKWTCIPRITIWHDQQTCRDYTPFGWDWETSTCSLLINIAHDDQLGQWAKKLRAGEMMPYLKIQVTSQSPHPTDMVVSLVDSNSLGYLLALKQLTIPVSRFEGVVLAKDLQIAKLLTDCFRTTLTALTDRNQIADWLIDRGYCSAHTWFYIAGSHPFVSELCMILKFLGYPNVSINGVWY